MLAIRCHSLKSPVGAMNVAKLPVELDGGLYETLSADISWSPRINWSLSSVHPNCVLIISTSDLCCSSFTNVIK